MLERWKSWRKKQKQKEQKNDLQDFLAQDGSNVFISQLQRLNRRLDRNNVKWQIFKSSKSKTQKKSDAENMGLDNLAPELRILVLAETWDGLSRDRRRRLLRVKPSFAILPLERCLCPLHTEALSCLIRTRTISELIPGYVESKTGQWWKMHGDENTIQHKLARAMMKRAYFASLQKKKTCPVCKNALLKYQNEIMDEDDDHDGVNGRNDADPTAAGTRSGSGTSTSTMSNPIPISRTNTLDLENMLQFRRRRSHQSKLSAFQSKQKNRSLKSVLIEDTEELCYMLASCTKAIIGIRVYSCLIKKYRRKKRDKNRLGILKIRQIPNLAMKQFKSSLKVISGVGSANISRSFRESASENRETILSDVDDEIDEEDEGYPEEFFVFNMRRSIMQTMQINLWAHVLQGMFAQSGY